MYNRIIFGCFLLVTVIAFSPVSANPRFRRQSGGANANASAEINLGNITSQLQQLLNSNATSAATKAAVQLLLDALNNIQNTTDPILKNGLGILLNSTKALGTALQDFVTNVQQSLSQVSNTTQQAASTVLKDLLAPITQLQKQIEQITQNLRKGLEELLNSTLNDPKLQATIKDLLKRLDAGQLNDAISKLANNSLTSSLNFPQLLSQLQQTLSPGTLLTLVNQVAKAFTTIISSVVQGLVGLLGGLLGQQGGGGLPTLPGLGQLGGAGGGLLGGGGGLLGGLFG